MNKIKAFTMSEALIVLGIIAVIATLSVIAVQNAKPDTDVVMFKKAYKTTHDIVQNLYYDKELYPNATDPMEVAYKSDASKLLAMANNDFVAPFNFNFSKQVSNMALRDNFTPAPNCKLLDDYTSNCAVNCRNRITTGSTAYKPECVLIQHINV